MGESRTPSLLISLALHVLVLGAMLIVWPFQAKPLQISDSVPVTIISHAPPETPSAPTAAPEPTPETTPEPAPVPSPAPPPPPPPRPTPVPKASPAPPPPKPTPAPSPKPVAQAPAPTPKKAESKPVDLSALAASLPQSKPNAKPTRPSSSVDLSELAASLPKSSGARGPARPAAAPIVSPGPVRPLSGDELGAVQAKLMRLWNPNCGVEGAGKVNVRVEMKLGPDGHLLGTPVLLDRPLVEAGGAVVAASAQRAITAAQRGDPYTELPRDRYPAWKDIIVRFNAKEACGG